MIEVHDIQKHYGKIEALNSVSFSVEKGELFGLIGPDGAGKTTLFRILATLMLADKGTATVEGLDIRKDYKQLRRKLGYMPGKFSLYPDLSVEENLSFFATIFGTTIHENYDLIAPIYKQIEPFKKRSAGKLSGGMKQKLALCCALIHKPTVLFLDEPTTGVDPVSRKDFWMMLQELREAGITIIASTPYMDEAKLCSRIAFINKGRLLDVDTPKSITEKFKGDIYLVHGKDLYNIMKFLRRQPEIETCFSFGNSLHIKMKPSDEHADKSRLLVQTLEKSGFTNTQITRTQATIEDCFIDLSQTEEA
jgi:ABC-2 type transport system ATP-binding protein